MSSVRTGSKSSCNDGFQATAMQLATKAAGGDQASIARFLDWVDEFETRAAATKPTEFPFSEADLQVLRSVHERMKLCILPATDK